MLTIFFPFRAQFIVVPASSPVTGIEYLTSSMKKDSFVTKRITASTNVSRVRCFLLLLGDS